MRNDHPRAPSNGGVRAVVRPGGRWSPPLLVAATVGVLFAAVLLANGPRLDRVVGAAVGPSISGSPTAAAVSPPVSAAPEPTKPFVPPPPPTTTPAAVSLRLCTASDVRISLLGWGSAAGTLYALLGLDATGTPCAVTAVPAVALDDAAGHSLVAQPSGPPGPADLAALQPSLRLRIGWGSWCGATPAGPLVYVVGLGNGLILRQTMPPDFVAACQGPPMIFTDPMFVP